MRGNAAAVLQAAISLGPTARVTWVDACANSCVVAMRKMRDEPPNVDFARSSRTVQLVVNVPDRFGFCTRERCETLFDIANRY